MYSSTAYDLSQQSYWSAQSAVIQPGCIFHPNTTDQISQAITVLNKDEIRYCQIAVRAGG